MRNPFQITKPVAPAEVIDRNAETARLLELAEEANNARVVAPRRFGKTSLMKRVQAELAERGWITIYVDLLGIVTLDDVAVRIEMAYAEALEGRLARWFAGLRRSLQPTITLGGGPVPGALEISLSGQRVALIARLGLPVRVHERTGQRVHVVFDEFQELDTIGGEADAVVRSEIQHHGEAASYVFAGSQLRVMEMMFSDRKRAFYGQTERVALSPLSPQALGNYIAAKFEQTGKELTPVALGALLDLVEGHPQRAMAAAHSLWDVTVDVADHEPWDEALATLMEGVEDELKTTWAQMTPAMRTTLVAIARGERPYRRGNRERGAGVARAIAALEGTGVIAKTGDRWRVIDPLLSAWVRGGRIG